MFDSRTPTSLMPTHNCPVILDPARSLEFAKRRRTLAQLRHMPPQLQESVGRVKDARMRVRKDRFLH